ncbi:hypothetical protein [Aquimonas sp.]|jgi:hypothetical protein|uniref:hypothetical protein n=1 Tax=Aquimonas sp. TaxID=1872588 RepID=UPI0037C09AB6
MHEPHNPTCCPACGSAELMRGSIAIGDGSGAHFHPEGLPLLRLERSVRLMAGTRFFACLACDLVWSNAVPGHLSRLLTG